MYVLHIHKNYNLKQELTDDEYSKFKKWLNSVTEDESVKTTIPDFYHTANVRFYLFSAFA